MNVTLDGKSLNDTFTAGDSLQSLIDAVRTAHLGTRIVVAVTLDGRQLMDDELSTQLGQSVEGVEQVQLISAEPCELVAAAFREISSQLAQVGSEHEALADQMQSGESSHAVRQFSELLQVWQTCQQAIVEGAAMLSRDMTTMETGGRSVRESLDALVDQLRELRGAFEANDMVLLSDMFRYEMPNTCRTWHNILNELADQLEAAAPAAT